MNTIANHDQKIALSDRDRALVLALLLSHRQSLEADFKRKSGRVWRTGRLLFLAPITEAMRALSKFCRCALSWPFG